MCKCVYARWTISKKVLEFSRVPSPRTLFSTSDAQPEWRARELMAGLQWSVCAKILGLEEFQLKPQRRRWLGTPSGLDRTCLSACTIRYVNLLTGLFREIWRVFLIESFEQTAQPFAFSVCLHVTFAISRVTIKRNRSEWADKSIAESFCADPSMRSFAHD